MAAPAFFYDSWGFAVLCNASDPDHAAVSSADRQLEEMGYVATTSDYVFDETLMLLHAAAGPHVALTFLELTEARIAGEDLMLLEVNAERRRRASRLFRRLAPRAPKLSFTDCTSLCLMKELGIRLAFSADPQFAAAGGAIRPLFERKGKRLEPRLPKS
jgi:predicted nucleic acid-binding protein